MKTDHVPIRKNSRVLFFTLATLIIVSLLLSSCIPGYSSIILINSSNTNTTSDTNENSTSDPNNTQPDQTTTPAHPTTTNDTTTDTQPTPTEPSKPVEPPIFTVTEIPKTGVRPYYTAFTIKTIQAGVTYTDYTLALRASSSAKPSPLEMTKGTTYTRTISDTAINIYAWGTLDTTYTQTMTEAGRRALLLRPTTTYVLYGMEKINSDPAAVREIARFTTDAEPSTTATQLTPIDDSIFNSIEFSIRTSENIIVAMQAFLPASTSFSTFYGIAGTHPPNVNTLIQPLGSSPTAVNSPSGSLLNLLISSPIDATHSTWSYLIDSQDYWFKTTTAF